MTDASPSSSPVINKLIDPLNFLFSDKKTTLIDADVDREILKIYNHLVDNFGVSLRDGVLNH